MIQLDWKGGGERIGKGGEEKREVGHTLQGTHAGEGKTGSDEVLEVGDVHVVGCLM